MKDGEYYDATNRRKMVVVGKKYIITEHDGEIKEFDLDKGGALILKGQWELIEVSKLDRLIDRLRA